MNSLELTSAVTALANAIACKLSAEELALVASVFVQLGDTLATIAARDVLCENEQKYKFIVSVTHKICFLFYNYTFSRDNVKLHLSAEFGHFFTLFMHLKPQKIA